ncbi:MAG: phytoene desaturase family protein [Paracoccaceae bacterium]
MPSSDVIVIGAGPNGLACATRLAKAGRKVTLLDAADRPGGGMLGWDFAPGFRTPGLAHLTMGLDPRILSGMDLARHGLTFHDPLPTVLLSPGAPVTVRGGTATGEGLDPEAAARFATLHARLAAYAAALAPARAMTPPRLAAKGNDWLGLGRFAWGIRRMGRTDLREFLRLLLINMADVADDEVGHDLLGGLLAFDATLGAWAGPRSPNTLILYLDRLSRGASLLTPKGGMEALAAAMTAAATAAGVTVRPGARVTRIDTADHRAAGVTLASGETLAAPLIVSAIAPQTTFRSLTGPRPLDAGFFTRAGHIRARGATARLHLALKTLPDLKGADPRARFVVAPSVDAVERAWNPVKYGEVPDRPVMELTFPSAADPSLAPEGHHVLSANVQFAPHAPKDPEAARAAFLANSFAVIEDHLPGTRALTTHSELLMPADVEARFGLPGGCWHAAELSVEQMFFLRPLREAARYATPLPGLWLAGAGSHPGGGIEGAAGWNAAERILKEGA